MKKEKEVSHILDKEETDWKEYKKLVDKFGFTRKKPKLYKCKSFGKAVDERNGFYRICFDTLLTGGQVEKNVSSGKLYCLGCQKEVEEIKNEEKE